MPSIATLFSGGGLADVGAMAAGYTPIWGVEYDASIAEVHSANIPGRMHVAKVQDVDPFTLERPDLLHASPPCTTASVANANGGETALDREMAESICRFLRVLTPNAITLENVMGYRKYESYRRILATLDELGYWTHSDILNSADLGVPQTRKRLILRAVRDGIPAPLPPKTAWQCWYAAIEDLIPTLPESKFADWQLKRLPENLLGDFYWNPSHDDDLNPASCPAATISCGHEAAKHRAFLIDGDNAQKNGPIHRSWVRPAPTITQCSKPLGYLVKGDAAGDRCPTICEAADPAFTIKTPSGGRLHRAWLNKGRVVAMTPRTLARFQSVPDTYLLPDKNSLAVKIIGNGVPCRMYEAIARSLI